jgi:hypothetical protein
LGLDCVAGSSYAVVFAGSGMDMVQLKLEGMVYEVDGEPDAVAALVVAMLMFYLI